MVRILVICLFLLVLERKVASEEKIFVFGERDICTRNDTYSIAEQRKSVQAKLTVFGVEQEIKGEKEDDILKRAILAVRYMSGVKNDYVTKKCRNFFPLCTFWAAIGECERNPSLKKSCGPSCQSCDIFEEIYLEEISLLEEVQKFGVAQIADGSERVKTLNLINSTISYMNDLEIDEKLKEECQNRNSLCSFWALNEGCERNFDYMMFHCAPSCQTCHLLDFNTRCPPRDPSLQPLVKNGELGAFFDNIIKTTDFDVKILSQPTPEDSDKPWFITIKDFLTKEECNNLISAGEQIGLNQCSYTENVDGLAEVPLNFYGYYARENKTKIRNSLWCRGTCSSNSNILKLKERFRALTLIPEEYFEPFLIIRYYPDQYFALHHDYIKLQASRACGPRILTFFLYLSDVQQGGETEFPELNITLKPQPRMIALWSNVQNQNLTKPDARLKHRAHPVLKGIKYSASLMVHLYDYATPSRRLCD